MNVPFASLMSNLWPDIHLYLPHLPGKEVPETAVLEMKANFKLPEESDNFIDEIFWIENDREAAQPIIDR